MSRSDDQQPQQENDDELNEEIEEDIVIEREDEQPKDTIKRLRDNLKECTAKKQEYLDGWQRAKADVINSKKDFSKERERIKERAIEGVVSDLLPVLDSFEMAFVDEAAWQEIDAQWRSGVEHIHAQLKSMLKGYGVEAIRPAVGEDFDPQLHTSVDTEVTTDEEESDTIADCEKTGYRLEDHIVRSAHVVVFKMKSDA